MNEGIGTRIATFPIHQHHSKALSVPTPRRTRYDNTILNSEDSKRRHNNPLRGRLMPPAAADRSSRSVATMDGRQQSERKQSETLLHDCNTTKSHLPSLDHIRAPRVVEHRNCPYFPSISIMNKNSKFAIFAKNKMVIGGKGKCSKVFDIPDRVVRADNPDVGSVASQLGAGSSGAAPEPGRGERDPCAKGAASGRLQQRGAPSSHVGRWSSPTPDSPPRDSPETQIVQNSKIRESR